MKEFAFNNRSKFLAQCEKSICDGQHEVFLDDEKSGYKGRVVVIISETDSKKYGVEQPDGADWPYDWLHARIRAAATALHRCKKFGRFEIAHHDGKLTIRLA